MSGYLLSGYLLVICYLSLEELQLDLDQWVESYNNDRTHQGKICCGRTPLQTFIAGKEIVREKTGLSPDLTNRAAN